MLLLILSINGQINLKAISTVKSLAKIVLSTEYVHIQTQNAYIEISATKGEFFLWTTQVVFQFLLTDYKYLKHKYP